MRALREREISTHSNRQVDNPAGEDGGPRGFEDVDVRRIFHLSPYRVESDMKCERKGDDWNRSQRAKVELE